MAYDNTNSGALFKNTKRPGKDNDPDYTGKLDVGGTEYWLSAWIKEGKSGGKFMSLSVRPKEQREAQRIGKPAADPDADVPF